MENTRTGWVQGACVPPRNQAGSAARRKMIQTTMRSSVGRLEDRRTDDTQHPKKKPGNPAGRLVGDRQIARQSTF